MKRKIERGDVVAVLVFVLPTVLSVIGLTVTFIAWLC